MAPAAAEVRLDYAFALQDAGQFEAAAAEAQEACRLQPDFAQAWETLGILQQAIGETAEAEIAYRKANALAPTIGRRVKLATLISPIMASREAIVAERERMASAIDSVPADADATHNDPMREALWSNFYLAYHALDDRDLQTRSAAMYRRLFPSLEHVAAHCRGPRPAGGKIRVGIASQFFHNHSIGRTSRGFFAELSRDAFDVVAIFIEPRVDDDISGFIRGHAARSIDVPRDLAVARRLIEAERLDVLFYPDIGMEPFSYFLAFSRLAPVQCVTYGHPDTTGIPAIDYFVSNDLYEPPGAAGALQRAPVPPARPSNPRVLLSPRTAGAAEGTRIFRPVRRRPRVRLSAESVQVSSGHGRSHRRNPAPRRARQGRRDRGQGGALDLAHQEKMGGQPGRC